MPTSPTWEDTVEDSPSWDDTVEEKAEVPERGIALPEGLGEQLRKQDEFQQNLRAYTGGSFMSPGGPDMDFARALYQKVPAKIGEGLHAVMKPVEAVATPVINQMRQAFGGNTYALTGELPVDTNPGETVFRGLEPTADSRGIIPSLRRAAAGMTTPGGLALLPIAGGGGALAKGVQGAFALGAGAAIPGGIQAFIEADTPAEKRGAATDVALSALFAGTMGREAVRPRTSRATTPRAQQSEVVTQAKVEVPPAGAQVTPEITQFREGFEAGKITTSQDSVRAGLKATSIADLDFLLETTKRRYEEAKRIAKDIEKESDPIKRDALLQEHQNKVGLAQLPREAVEGAVDAGSNTREAVGFGERPLDWRTHPEVRAWIEKNAVDIWEKNAPLILKGMETPITEAAAPAAPAASLTPKELTRLRESNQPIPAKALDDIGAPVPAGYVLEGDFYVPEKTAAPEQPRAAAFFPRQSEALGLGEPALPPTIESVRAQRVSEARPPKEPSGTVEFPTEGENVKMRKSAERATTSPDIPESVQETIKTAPESFYRQQSMKRVEEAVSEMSEGDLAAVPRDSNLYTAARLEQAGRLFKEGKNDAGYEVFVELEKEGTRLGQLINQFKLLKGTRPEEVVRVIDKTLEKSGKDPLNPKQREEAIQKAEKSKEADRKLEESTEEWAKNPTPENAAKAEKSLLDAHEAGMELQRFVSKYQPRSTPAILKSILQGNLLTPISQARNIVGNMSFSPLRAGTRAAATGFDVLNNYLTKAPRTMTVQPIRGTSEVVKGFGRGVKQIPDIFLRGTGDTIKGETRAGLHPIKAWINQFAKNPEMPTTGGKITLQDRLNLAIEGTFGVPAEAMLRGLGAGDVPFREAARARATATELSLANVPKDQWSFAQKFPELFLNDTALARIQSETLRGVFQQPSKTLNLVTNWIRGKGDWFDLAVATVAPYKLTPWNIIGEILSYNPLIAVARSVHSSKIKNPREARLNAGKFIVGSMLTAAGWWLYKSGLMSPSLDQRDEAPKARVLSGEVMPPNHINLSGLKRAMNGGDPAFKAGDETADVFSAGGLAGSMFYMTANIGRDFERRPQVPDSEVWGAILRQSTLEQARFGMNQSFLSGVEGLLSAVREGNTDNYIRQWGNTVASIPLPNSLTVMSRASREYKPDFREDTFRKQMENIVRNKLGVANMDDYLPLKRGLWGEPMRETPEGRNAIMYHFFDVFKNKQVTSDPVPLELFRLWRKTGSTKVIPSLVEDVLTVNRQTYPLTAEYQSRYAELVGQARRQIVDAVVINPQFHKLSDEDKITLLDRVYRKGQDVGKAQFWQENGSKLTPKPSRAGFK